MSPEGHARHLSRANPERAKEATQCQQPSAANEHEDRKYLALPQEGAKSWSCPMAPATGRRGCPDGQLSGTTHGLPEVFRHGGFLAPCREAQRSALEHGEDLHSTVLGTSQAGKPRSTTGH